MHVLLPDSLPTVKEHCSPKERRFVFRDPFADGDDGDPIFHVVSSKIRFGGLGSVNPPYTTHFHKNHPFFSYSGT